MPNSSEPLEILIEPGTYGYRNAGDTAAFLVAVARLEEQWPAAQTAAFTEAPDRLRHFAPRLRPYSTKLRDDMLAMCDPNGAPARRLPIGTLLRWHLERGLRWRPLLRALPSIALRAAARRFSFSRKPGPSAGLDLNRPDRKELERILRSFSLIAVSGAGGLCDSFLPHAWSVLQLLDIASYAGVPTALFSQGLGPIENRALYAKARSVLPRVDLIGIRERKTSLPLLEEFGVPSGRIHVTGDDTIELAYRRRAQAPGACLGVNLRVAYYSSVDRELASSVLGSVAQFAKIHGLQTLPVPVSFVDRESDIQTVSEALGVPASDPCAGEPAAVVDLVGRCRMVVTGSYHGAVFALSQGIPAVALTRSLYYENKFLGLADMFGVGCEVVDLSKPVFPEKLLAALRRTLDTAPRVREPLLQSAREQIAASRAAYRRASEYVCARRGLCRTAPSSEAARRADPGAEPSRPTEPAHRAETPAMGLV